MFTLGDERFDLFVVRVVGFDYSKEMMSRASRVHEYGEKLVLKVADPHDIVLMKCATDRLKDVDDARKIIENFKMDWDVLVDEALVQISLGQDTAAFELGEFLEDLQKMGVPVSDGVLDKLYNIVVKQAKKKRDKFHMENK